VRLGGQLAARGSTIRPIGFLAITPVLRTADTTGAMEAPPSATDRARWHDAIDPAVEQPLADAVDRLAASPVLDATVMRVLTTLDDPAADTSMLVAALESDAGFAAYLLRYADSPARAAPIRARSIRQAVMLVGRRALRELALETATYRFIETAPGTDASGGGLHRHATAAAAAAALGADRVPADREVVYVAALLHDVGKLVLPLAFGAEACDAIARDVAPGPGRVLAERECLGVDHATAGALLARRWCLPAGVVDAIALHHGGTSGLASPSAEVAVVQLANELQRLLAGDQPDHALLDAALERCDADPTILDDLARHAVAQGAPLPAPGALGRRVAEVHGLSQTDDLTGAANRRHWLQSTRAELGRRRHGAIVLCVVDGVTGDTAGAVLGEVARVLGHHGTVGRLDRARFGVWIPDGADAARDAAAAAAAALRSTLAGHARAPRDAALTLACAAAPGDGDGLAALLDVAAARAAAASHAPAAGVSADAVPWIATMGRDGSSSGSGAGAHEAAGAMRRVAAA
jgi:putative nucleotidyltransferase with HDIG domain